MRRTIGAAGAHVILGELTRQRNFTFVREEDAAHDVIARMRRTRSSVALVLRLTGLLTPKRSWGSSLDSKLLQAFPTR